MQNQKLPPVFIYPKFPRIFDKRPIQGEGGGDVFHSYTKRATRLNRAVNAVSERIRVDPSSRVAHWVRTIDRLSRADKRMVLEQIVVSLERKVWAHPFRDAFLSLNESRMFLEIVEQLIEVLTDRDLRELVSGHADPFLERPDARGRDKEFEWFVAALFRRAGLPIALAEPDILVDFSGSIRSIAAKRLSSRKQVDSNIKKASQQIFEAGYPGYIFLDITRYIDPEALFIEHWQDEGRSVGARMDAFVRHPAVTNRRNDRVVGVFVRSAFPLISPGFEYGTSEKWLALGVSGGGEDEHMQIMNLLASGLRGV